MPERGGLFYAIASAMQARDEEKKKKKKNDIDKIKDATKDKNSQLDDIYNFGQGK